MQYYDVTTVDEPNPAQAAAIGGISAGAAEALAKVEGGAEAKVGFRIAASSTTGSDRMIVDVDLGGEFLPIDLGTWAFAPANRDRAVECVTARVREILVRRDRILGHLADLRAKVEAVIAGKGGRVRMVRLHFWPIEGSERFRLDELRHELRVEQFGLDPRTSELGRLEESYHGYGVRELTDCIRADTVLQGRMSELRRLLDEAGVTATLDPRSQVDLADGRVPPARIAERLVADASRTDDALGR